MLQTFLLFMNSILIHFKCLLQVPSCVELILSSLYFTRSVPGAGHSIAGFQHFRVVVNTLHGLFLISVHSSSAYNWSWREGNEKEKHACLSLLFPFPTSPVGCQLPAFLSLHPLPLQFCPCQRCAEIKDRGIAVRNLGKMCKKLNWDAKSLPSTCGR